MYNAYKEKDLGMTKESMMKRVAELEAKLQLLVEENVSLKASIEQALLNQTNLTETLDLKSEVISLKFLFFSNLFSFLTRYRNTPKSEEARMI